MINIKRTTIFSITVLMLMISVLFTACGENASDSSNASSQEQSSQNTNTVETKKVGEWVNIKKKAQADGQKHTVKFRISKIATDDKTVNKEIEEYNLSGRGDTIDQNIGNEDLQYVVAYYETNFPEEYPDEDYGLTNVTVSFKVTAPDGSDVIHYNGTAYPNLSETKDIGSVPQGYDFYSGQTYHGKIIYVMPKDCKNYCLKGDKYYFSPKK